MIYASTAPIIAVINCVSENVVWNTAILGSIASGSIEGMITREITIPINAPLIIAPITMDKGNPIFEFGLSLNRYTARTSKQFPAMTHGIIRGIADIIGLPVIRKDVMGVIMDIAIAGQRPAVRTQIIKQVLIIGPVIYTERFLKN